MNVMFNNTLYKSGDLHLDWQDRSFMYGDGLFETIMIKEGKVCFLDLHRERLLLGMKTLAMEVPPLLEEDVMKKALLNVAAMNGLSENARLKLQVWRKTGGLYTPQHNQVNTLIAASLSKARPAIVKKAAIAKRVKLHYSAYSAFKTCNALPYILAGIEMNERRLDEIILLDTDGNVSECSSSNIFWIKNGRIATPALTTGCISGIMRKHIIQQATLNHQPVQEVKAPQDVLLEADQVFCCNVTGIYCFQEIAGASYDTAREHELFKWIRPG